jgi:hypothetical protein
VPRVGQVDPFFGGSRAFWYDRILATRRNNFKPPIRSQVVKTRPGAKTGIRFIDFQSAAEWFKRNAEATPASAASAGAAG